MQSLLIVGGLCSVGIDLSSVHPENVSNMVAGSNLFLSGALGLNGQIPERLNPLERRSGLSRHISVALCSRPTILYLLST